MELTGQILLVGALLGSVFASVVGLAGAMGKRTSMVKSSILATRSVFFFVVAAGMVLLYALVTHDYSNRYVAGYTSDVMPLFYLITSYWGGEKGALITWVTVLYLLLYLLTGRRYVRDNPFWGYTFALSNLAGVFFFVIMLTASNPFEIFVTFTGPADGAGINPLLMNPFMVIHPPFQLAGFVAYTIPFAMAVAALATAERFGHWEQFGRRWMIFAWWSLSMGLLLGCLWSYMELGWGGFWGWDPVENAALLPWLIGTALIHVVFVDRGRHQFRRLSYFLIFLTYGMTIFATFLTRSQLIDSLHSFTESVMTPYFLYFMFLVFLASIVLLVWRWRMLAPRNHMSGWLSREAFVLLATLVFLLLGFIVLWGTMLPKLTQSPSIRGAINSIGAAWAHLLGRPYFPLTSAMHVDAKWFNRITAPFAFFILLLAAIAPGLRLGANRPRKTALRRQLWSFVIALVISVLIALVTVYFLALITNSGFTQVIKQATAKQFWGFGVLVTGLWVINYTVSDLVITARYMKRALSVSFGRAVIRLIRGNTRRYAGHFVHSMIALLAIGFFATSLGAAKDKLVLNPGRYVEVSGHLFGFAGLQSRFSSSESFATLTSNIVVMRKDQSVDPTTVDLGEKLPLKAVDEGPYVLVTNGAQNPRLWARLFAGSVAMRDLKLLSSDPQTLSLVLAGRDPRVLDVLPDVYSRWVDNLRKWAQAMPSGEVTVTPGTTEPKITLNFGNKQVFQSFIKGMTTPSQALWTGKWQARDLIVMVKGPGRLLQPEMRYYTFFDEPTSEVSINPGWLYNVYVAASGAKGADLAGLTVLVTPMANLIFLVNFLLLFLFLLYLPGADPKVETKEQPQAKTVEVTA